MVLRPDGARRPQRRRVAVGCAPGPLAKLLKSAAAQELRFSDSFDDALALLRQAAVLGLEGIVSKRSDQPYVSGTNRGWVKVKTHDWREAIKDRGELFKKR